MKGFYRIVLNWIFHLAGKMNRIKMWVFEWYSIIRKRHIYKNIRWTSEQQRQFDDFWKENYGRKISPRWHKLYQAFNGVFNAAYIPEILYTAGFEPRMNDCIYVKALEDKAFVESYTGKTDVVVPETIFSKSGGLYRDKDYNIITLQEAMDKLAGGG